MSMWHLARFHSMPFMNAMTHTMIMVTRRGVNSPVILLPVVLTIIMATMAPV